MKSAKRLRLWTDSTYCQSPRFMWPDKFPHLGAVLDGVEEEDYKP